MTACRIASSKQREVSNSGLLPCPHAVDVCRWCEFFRLSLPRRGRSWQARRSARIDGRRPALPDRTGAPGVAGVSRQGFDNPVCGVIYDGGKGPCCGVPLGGIGTGCLDLDPTGTFGFCSIFNGYPRQPKLFQPFLGLTVGDQVFVLADARVLRGGLLESCVEHGRDPYYPDRQRNPGFWHQLQPETTGVRAPTAINYWGHYPVADVEYELDSPVQVGVRAWSPFLPGNVKVSDTPAAVFEVQLRNTSDLPQSGRLALTFDGPLADAIRPVTGAATGAVQAPPVFVRRSLAGKVVGAVVSTQDASYALGAMEEPDRVETGGPLGPTTWSKIGQSLPAPSDADSGATVAVRYDLPPHANRTIRFVLAWNVPSWGERGIVWERMNALVYPTVDDTVNFIADAHEKLFLRILQWQQVVYAAHDYPVWLRDCLINSLSLITEDAYYAQPTGPIADWAAPNGLFGMIEASRVCPQIECIPCSWYGNMLGRVLLPLAGADHAQWLSPVYAGRRGSAVLFWTANRHVAVQQQSRPRQSDHAQRRLFRRHGLSVVAPYGRRLAACRFFPAVKKSTTLTATMGDPPFAVVGFPPGDKQTEWWEGWPWTGIATHAAGMHLSNMLVAEQMAVAAHDEPFAQQCREWFQRGSEDLESNNWHGDYYLLFNKPQSVERSDKVMANQLDAEWANAFLGVDRSVFPPDHVSRTLSTIRETCLNPTVGAVSFAARDGAGVDDVRHLSTRDADSGHDIVVSRRRPRRPGGMPAVHRQRCTSAGQTLGYAQYGQCRFRRSSVWHRLLPDDDPVGRARRD